MALARNVIGSPVPEWGRSLVMISGVDFTDGWTQRLSDAVNSTASTISDNDFVSLAYLTARFGDTLLSPEQRHVMTTGENGARIMGEYSPATLEIPTAMRVGAQTEAQCVGECTSEQFLRMHNPFDLPADSEDRRRLLFVGAAAGWIEKMRTVYRPAHRSASVVALGPIAVAAGSVLVGLYAVNRLFEYLGDASQIEANRDVRMAQLRYVAAASAYEGRIKAWYNSGDGTAAHPRTMPPPSEIELSTRTEIERDGTSFWQTLQRGGGSGLQRTVENAGTMLKWGAALAALYVVFNMGKR